MNLAKSVSAYGITEVLHFTTGAGLVGMMDCGAVLSRGQLPTEKRLEYVFKPNCAFRTDLEYLEFVSMSLTNINGSFFQICSGRWHSPGKHWWAVLSFRPCVLLQPGVVFTTTNNVYPHVRRGEGVEGLERLFVSSVKLKPDWTKQRAGWLDKNQPTCEQAEVLVPGKVSLEHLHAVYFKKEEHLDAFHGIAAALETPELADFGVHRPEVFITRQPT